MPNATPDKPDVYWQDLLTLTPRQVTINCLLSLPWLLLSWWLAYRGWWWAALPCSFFFFLTALRQAHDSYHRSIGLPPIALSILLYVLAALMFCSTHAIRYTHLQHHQYPLSDTDIEGSWARLPAWQAIILGPIFSLRSQAEGLLRGDRQTRREARWDVVIMLGMCTLAWISSWGFLRYHLLVMSLANGLTGFFAVWLVHHDCDPEGIFARTERRAWLNRVTVNLLYHIEHHLFPAVPANHLPTLAGRLDAISPNWAKQSVIPSKSFKARAVETNP